MECLFHCPECGNEVSTSWAMIMGPRPLRRYSGVLSLSSTSTRGSRRSAWICGQEAIVIGSIGRAWASSRMPGLTATTPRSTRRAGSAGSWGIGTWTARTRARARTSATTRAMNEHVYGSMQDTLSSGMCKPDWAVFLDILYEEPCGNEVPKIIGLRLPFSPKDRAIYLSYGVVLPSNRW